MPLVAWNDGYIRVEEKVKEGGISVSFEAEEEKEMEEDHNPRKLCRPSEKSVFLETPHLSPTAKLLILKELRSSCKLTGKSTYRIVTKSFLKDLNKRTISVPYNDKDGEKNIMYYMIINKKANKNT
ncbi:hypothetical protein HGM15179_010331 [Zosterops borbonicus]|uniref:Uncharacterized protein n=1 Tax=Zosterops borbonicus TaxID=364589 RepID=A0A8K1LJZ2_9PASS|nr:hypothetical protein HGM15179_010331 [Zosterops borbonicus]